MKINKNIFQYIFLALVLGIVFVSAGNTFIPSTTPQMTTSGSLFNPTTNVNNTNIIIINITNNITNNISTFVMYNITNNFTNYQNITTFQLLNITNNNNIENNITNNFTNNIVFYSFENITNIINITNNLTTVVNVSNNFTVINNITNIINVTTILGNESFYSNVTVINNISFNSFYNVTNTTNITNNITTIYNLTLASLSPYLIVTPLYNITFNDTLNNQTIQNICSAFTSSNAGGWSNTSLNTTTTLNAQVNNNLVVLGNVSFKRPYAQFSSNTTQQVASTSTPFATLFEVNEGSYLITKTSNTNFTFQQQGEYLIELSAVVTSSVNARHFELWLRKDGTDIPRSNTLVYIPNTNTQLVLSVMFIIPLNTTNTLQVMYASSDGTTVSMPFTSNTSYSPAVPSIIMTVSKVSELTP
jgi:hypothetical protein